MDYGHLDEMGVALTLPTCYSWGLVGERRSIPYEAPQGRRLNVIGFYCTHGVEAGKFVFESLASLPKSRAKKRRKTLAEQAAAHGLRPEEVGTFDSERFLAFVWKVAGRPAHAPADWRRARPLMIVVDNYSVHKSELVQTVLPVLAAADVYVVYLPAYSPELSGIEPVWHAVKHHEMPERSFKTLGELKRAVDAALTQKAAALQRASQETAQLLPSAA